MSTANDILKELIGKFTFVIYWKIIKNVKI